MKDLYRFTMVIYYVFSKQLCLQATLLLEDVIFNVGRITGKCVIWSYGAMREMLTWKHHLFFSSETKAYASQGQLKLHLSFSEQFNRKWINLRMNCLTTSWAADTWSSQRETAVMCLKYWQPYNLIHTLYTHIRTLTFFPARLFIKSRWKLLKLKSFIKAIFSPFFLFPLSRGIKYVFSKCLQFMKCKAATYHGSIFQLKQSRLMHYAWVIASHEKPF